MLDIKNPRVYQVILVICLGVFLLAGIKTDIFWLSWKPISSNLFSDFHIYERAVNDALTGPGPYSLRDIGDGYLYPPPALIIVEIFHYIEPFQLKFLIYSLVNVVLLMIIVNRVSKYYGYSIKETWYWYILCLGFAPFHELIFTGQINVITLFGIFLFFLWQETSPIISGGGLSLAILTKVSPILLFGQLLITKNYKVMVSTFIWLGTLTALSILRYGASPMFTYPKFFFWLSSQFPIDNNSQSFVSKLVMTFGSAMNGSEIQFTQRILMLYIFAIMAASMLLTIVGRQSKEPAFIIIILGMTILPNVMWYHHYVFILLPILVWIGWRQLDPGVTFWCLFGLIIVQIDRYYLTYGLLIHVFVHLSVLLILAWQIQQYYFQRKKQDHIISVKNTSG